MLFAERQKIVDEATRLNEEIAAKTEELGTLETLSRQNKTELQGIEEDIFVRSAAYYSWKLHF